MSEEEEEKKGSFLKKLLVALLLLLVAAGVVAWTVPLVECVLCQGHVKYDVLHPRFDKMITVECECKNGKMTLVQKYRLVAKALLP